MEVYEWMRGDNSKILMVSAVGRTHSNELKVG